MFKIAMLLPALVLFAYLTYHSMYYGLAAIGVLFVLGIAGTIIPGLNRRIPL